MTNEDISNTWEAMGKDLSKAYAELRAGTITPAMASAVARMADSRLRGAKLTFQRQAYRKEALKDDFMDGTAK